MTLPTPTADAPPASVRVSAVGGRVTVVTGSAFSVKGAADVRRDGAVATVAAGSSRIDVTVPAGAHVAIGTTSGRVQARGRLGDAAITSASGRVSVEHAASVDIRCGSGRVEVGSVDGMCRVRAETGRVSVEQAGTADVSTESGRIEVGSVSGPVRAHSVSGRITIGLSQAADVDAETISGRVEVRVPGGVVAAIDRGDGDPGPETADCHVRAASVSGRVDVVSASR